MPQGNWLRDYSQVRQISTSNTGVIGFVFIIMQAMDIGGLSKLTAQTLVTLVSILSFMVGTSSCLTSLYRFLSGTQQTFGLATAEFEVSHDRLGVYLPVVSLESVPIK